MGRASREKRWRKNVGLMDAMYTDAEGKVSMFQIKAPHHGVSNAEDEQVRRYFVEGLKDGISGSYAKVTVIHAHSTHPDTDHIDGQHTLFSTNFDQLLLQFAPPSTKAKVWQSAPDQFTKAILPALLVPFLSKQDRAALIGDLHEGYSRHLRTVGANAAIRWYCREVALSLVPLIWASLKRVSGLEKLLSAWGTLRQ